MTGGRPLRTSPASCNGSPRAARAVLARRNRPVARSIGKGVAAGAALAAIALAGLLGMNYFRGARPVQVVRSSLLPPPNWSFVPNNFAVSPDGSRLAFVAMGPDGTNTLWVRALSAPGGQQITGAEGAAFPFWSPDSHRIGFFAESKLKITDIAGSAVQILCQAQMGLGGTWNNDGTIVFAQNAIGSLHRIPATGGVPAPQ